MMWFALLRGHLQHRPLEPPASRWPWACGLLGCSMEVRALWGSVSCYYCYTTKAPSHFGESEVELVAAPEASISKVASQSYYQLEVHPAARHCPPPCSASPQSKVAIQRYYGALGRGVKLRVEGSRHPMYTSRLPV